MSTEISHPVFKKPYYIKELGEEGLTARDIAESLGVLLKRIHQRLKRSFIEQAKDIQDWRLVTIVTAIELDTYVERDTETFALNTRAAKAFVATYNSHSGRSYLDFLFDCEQVATEVTPKLIAKIQELTEKLAACELASLKRDKKLLRATRRGMILAPVYTQTLHEGLQRSWEMRDKAALENSLLLKAQMEHTQKTLEGLAHKIRNLQKQIDGEDIKEKNKVIRLISKNDEIPS